MPQIRKHHRRSIWSRLGRCLLVMMALSLGSLVAHMVWPDGTRRIRSSLDGRLYTSVAFQESNTHRLFHTGRELAASVIDRGPDAATESSRARAHEILLDCLNSNSNVAAEDIPLYLESAARGGKPVRVPDPFSRLLRRCCLAGMLGTGVLLLCADVYGRVRRRVQRSRSQRERAAIVRGQCPQCGYSMKGLASWPCPECGWGAGSAG